MQPQPSSRCHVLFVDVVGQACRCACHWVGLAIVSTRLCVYGQLHCLLLGHMVRHLASVDHCLVHPS